MYATLLNYKLITTVIYYIFCEYIKFIIISDIVYCKSDYQNNGGTIGPRGHGTTY